MLSYCRYIFNSQLYSAQYWVSQGCPREKLVIGLPTYGRSWTLAGAEHGINAPAVSGGDRGPVSNESGFLAYNEICQFIKYLGWSKEYVPYMKTGPYAYKVGIFTR